MFPEQPVPKDISQISGSGSQASGSAKPAPPPVPEVQSSQQPSWPMQPVPEPVVQQQTKPEPVAPVSQPTTPLQPSANQAAEPVKPVAAIDTIPAKPTTIAEAKPSTPAVVLTPKPIASVIAVANPIEIPSNPVVAETPVPLKPKVEVPIVSSNTNTAAAESVKPILVQQPAAASTETTKPAAPFAPAPTGPTIQIRKPPIKLDAPVTGKPAKKFFLFTLFGALLKTSLLLILLIPLVGFGFVAGISYEYINIGNPVLQKKIQKLFFGLPYFPKPVKYVVTSAIDNQRSIKSSSLEASFELEDINSVLGGVVTPKDNRVFASGFYDFKTPGETKYHFTTNFLGVAELELLGTGKKLFINPHVLPEESFTRLEITDRKDRAVILDKWIEVSTGELPDLTIELEDVSEYLGIISPDLISSVKMTEDKDTYTIDFQLEKTNITKLFTTLEDHYKKLAQESKAVKVASLYDSFKKLEKVTLQMQISKFDLNIKSATLNVNTSLNLTEVLKSLPLVSTLSLPLGNPQDKPFAYKLNFKQNELNKNFEFSDPENSLTVGAYQELVTQTSPLFGMETAKLEYLSALADVEKFKQEILVYYLQNSAYPDVLDPLPSVARYKKLEEEKILFYRKLDLAHWGLFVSFPDPTIKYPSLKKDPALDPKAVPGPSEYKPYIAFIFIANAADPQTQYYAKEEIANIAPDVILREASKPIATPEEPIQVEPSNPDTGSDKGDSPFGGLLN